ALRLLGQHLQRGQAVAHHFAGFLQEDLQEFLVAFVVGGGRGRGLGQRGGGRREIQRRQSRRGRGARRRRSGVDGGRRLVRLLGGASHEGPQFAVGLVPDEQLLGQRGLVVQHVDQEAERAEVGAQLVESAGRALLLDFRHDDV